MNAALKKHCLPVVAFGPVGTGLVESLARPPLGYRIETELGHVDGFFIDE